MSDGEIVVDGRPKGLCLCYHAISESWEAPLSVTPQTFAEQIEYLIGRGFRPCTFSELALGRGDPRSLAITFDDAFQSVADHALPILADLGAVATVFVPTSYISEGKPLAWEGTDHWLQTGHADELSPMNWQTLRELYEAGWEIGSHTVTHPDLTRLDDVELDRELVESRSVVANELGLDEVSLAYPYGKTSARVQEAARRAGYSCAASLPKGAEGSSLFDVGRIGIYHADGALAFKAKCSPVVTALRRSPAWKVLGSGLRSGRRLLKR